MILLNSSCLQCSKKLNSSSVLNIFCCPFRSTLHPPPSCSVLCALKRPEFGLWAIRSPEEWRRSIHSPSSRPGHYRRASAESHRSLRAVMNAAMHLPVFPRKWRTCSPSDEITAERWASAVSPEENCLAQSYTSFNAPASTLPWPRQTEGSFIPAPEHPCTVIQFLPLLDPAPFSSHRYWDQHHSPINVLNAISISESASWGS